MTEASVTRTVTLAATRDEVWRALTTPVELSAWLGEVVELQPRAGGTVIVRARDGSTRRGVVETAETGRSLVLRWRRLEGTGQELRVGGATRVAFELRDDGGRTRLTVREEPVPLATSGARG